MEEQLIQPKKMHSTNKDPLFILAFKTAQPGL